MVVPQAVSKSGAHELSVTEIRVDEDTPGALLLVDALVLIMEILEDVLVVDDELEDKGMEVKVLGN